MPFMWAQWLCRFVQTSAAVLLTGTAILRLLACGTSPRPACHGWRWLEWASGVVLLVATPLQLALVAADMSDLPLFNALKCGALDEVLSGTRFGAVWQVRMGLLVGWFVLMSVGALTGRTASRSAITIEFGAGLLAIAFLGSLVFAGHAQASEKSAWLLPGDVCHALAAGAWPGGLLPLALLLAKSSRDATLVPATVKITQRFSRMSVLALCILAASGVLNGIGMVGTFTAFYSSMYGRLVLCKATLLVSMVCLGAANRRLVWRQNSGHPEQTIRQLWRNVSIESALAVAVLAATEALATSAPPMPTG